MIQLTKYINVPVFIISFAIGLFFVYATVGDMRTIYIYPSPENAELMLYRDKASQCFAFEQKEVECPVNPMEIAKIPTQG
jgi:hypothetical protein